MSNPLKALPREQRRAVRLQRLQSPQRDRKISHQFVNKARDFFKRIGLPFEIVPSYQSDPPGSFFKGCWLNQGKLFYCPARVQVGELLHEAGHLALLPKDQWPLLMPGKLDEVYPPLGGFRFIGDAAVEAWDYAAALAADIPVLAVFDRGFNGAGWQVWESFHAHQHPGFALLRFLGMSSAWGQCDRWLVGDAAIPDGEEALASLMLQCSLIERKGILAFFEKLVEDSTEGSDRNG